VAKQIPPRGVAKKEKSVCVWEEVFGKEGFSLADRASETALLL
jgi:hypothetical protein